MTERMLVVGASGHLGRKVASRAMAAGWMVVGTRFSSAGELGEVPLDIRDATAVRDLVRRVFPSVVIHTAAGREDWRVIADGAAHVAAAAYAVGARLVHVSSEAVFSGRDVEYDETAMPDPTHLYGAAKAAAETAVRAIDPSAAVVRTSLILGDGRGDHEILTHDLIAGRRTGVLLTDQVRKPIHVDDLSDALLELALNDHHGILNVAGADPISYYDLGVLVARRDGLDPALIPAATTAEAGLPLPADIRLSTTRAEALLHTRLRGVQEFLAATVPA
ncbi:dTDP-4-dehydrorhamnose reductase [Actinoplanes tereljensis]|uniref:dTDP-4-dehydrorhamnose reductase n=1 Tax=Paractinoplanes tereljensis TaxID=571912 RepID=A0A919TTT3_9ACTN|nr:sugar nucleotide-binding protein [Actinoplanes tereljensis]GIF22041.1 dTDP-4-dehydrorhamnose reductase [Actinoplanes tereljensis]